MAKVFLDANCFIDAVHRRPELNILESLKGHVLYISTLSIEIYCYIFKINIPSKELSKQVEKFQMIDLSETIINQSLVGPTTDLEDNIQLHSAAEAECDLFLTSDQKLLNMKFFGKLQILQAVKV